MRINKIKYKIIIVFGGFTFLLLSIILIYFYTSNLQYVKTQSENRVNLYLRLLEEQIQRECEFTLLDLNDLKNQMDASPDITNEKQTQFLEAKVILEDYLLDIPNKYSGITYFKKNQSKIISGQTTRLFNGEIVANIILKASNGKELSKINDEPGKNCTKEKKLSKRIIDRELVINIPPVDNSEGSLIAKIKTDYIFEQIISRMNLPATVKVLVVTSDSIVIYSESNKLINQKINPANFIAGIKFNPTNKYTEANGETDEFIFFKWKKYAALNIFLGVIDDYSIDAVRLKNFTLEIFSFSNIILFIVLIFVFYFANKISGSIQKITDVAELVAEGKFNRKLDIKRNDELGVLIKSFNDMIFKLDSNYKALNDLNIQLENKIIELTETRNELSHKQRLALVGETISKISHEIQNKISGISIWVQNLELQTSDDSPAKFYIEEIKTALKSFQDKLINFKKFYRQPQLNPEEIELITFLRNIFQKYSLELKAKEITLISNFNDKTITMLLDTDQFEEAIVNILLNAIYFSPESSTIELNISDTIESIIINICDNGPGIKEDDIRKIFQPFYTTKSSGSGLGLAIANNIILAHNGKLNYFNRKEGGACFQIVLPNNLSLKYTYPREHENSSSR